MIIVHNGNTHLSHLIETPNSKINKPASKPVTHSSLEIAAKKTKFPILHLQKRYRSQPFFGGRRPHKSQIEPFWDPRESQDLFEPSSPKTIDYIVMHHQQRDSGSLPIGHVKYLTPLRTPRNPLGSCIRSP